MKHTGGFCSSTLLVAAVALMLTAAACGGGDSGTPSSPTPTPSPAPTPTPSPTPTPTPSGATITITSSGVSPRTVTVATGGRVTFVNNDSRTHEMNSDPHPEHTDCPAINDVGFLAVGQSKATGNLNTPRTCRFHDHNQPSTTSLQGTITIQ